MRQVIQKWSSMVILVIVLVSGALLGTSAGSGLQPALAQGQGSGGAPAFVNINTASKSQLTALPGIGPRYAQKIVDGRPYSSKEELVQRGILPKGTYKKLQNKVTASPK